MRERKTETIDGDPPREMEATENNPRGGGDGDPEREGQSQRKNGGMNSVWGAETKFLPKRPMGWAGVLESGRLNRAGLRKAEHREGKRPLRWNGESERGK